MLTQSIHTNNNYENHELILKNLKYSKPQLTNQFWTQNYQKNIQGEHHIHLIHSI